MEKLSREIVRVRVYPQGYDQAISFKTLEEAQDYLLEKLHCAGEIRVTYKDSVEYTIKSSRQANHLSSHEKLLLLQKVIKKAISEGCKGRTFYEGYFDVDFKDLSRVDRMIKLLDDAMKGIENDG